jgi:hypothetical protein
MQGIRLLRFHTDQIKSGEAVQFIEQYIKAQTGVNNARTRM